MTTDSEKISGLLSPDVTLYSVEPHILSVYPESEPIHHYDQNVPFYDRVIGNRIYNHVMWGYNISEFLAFTHSALLSRKSGWVLDAGCGSLVFTSEIYAEYSERPVLMLDQSIQMLRADYVVKCLRISFSFRAIFFDYPFLKRVSPQLSRYLCFM
jgi:hypothetical protein